MKNTYILLLFLAFFTACEAPQPEAENTSLRLCDRIEEKAVNKDKLQNGDLVFQTSRSSQSRAIRLATASEYCHVGIVYEQEGEIMVYEAVGPVKLTPINTWIANGEESHYAVKRLRNSDKILNPELLAKMKTVGERFKGKAYDWAFGWTDDKIYCSELVWKIYKEAAGIELGALRKLGDFDLTHLHVKAKLTERYGDKIPMEELVISPADVFNAAVLETVDVE